VLHPPIAYESIAFLPSTVEIMVSMFEYMLLVSSWRALMPDKTRAPLPPEVGFAASELQLAPSRTVGGSPATAREIMPRSHEPAGAAPRPTSLTPNDAPFKWTR
jgi:hypothetical protein